MEFPIPSITTSSGPSTAEGRFDSMFDSSGWNVNFGGGSIKSDAAKGLGGYLPYALLAVGLIVAFRMTRRRS